MGWSAGLPDRHCQGRRHARQWQDDTQRRLGGHYPGSGLPRCWRTQRLARGVSVAGGDRPVDQVNESDYHFVTRLARQYDCTAKLAEGMLMVLPRQSGQSATGRRIEPLVLGRADVGSFDVTFDDRSLMRTVKTRYQLPGSGEVKSVELKNPKAPATAMGEHVDRHLYTSRGEAEQAAKARLASFSRSSASVRLELPGRGDLFAERSLLLQGFKAGIDGEFLIDSVEHTYSSSGWTTVVQCNGGRGGKG